jgi:hypothetical protein
MGARGAAGSYRITSGDGRSTEELVDAGGYAYAHSCVTPETFPARHFDAGRVREIVLLEFDHGVTSEEAIAEAVQLGLERPMYEDALYVGIKYPDVQREHRWSFSMTPGSAISAAETFSVSGATPAVGSWGSRGSTTVGAGTIVSGPFADTAARRAP